MEAYTQDKLNEILGSHKLWLDGEEGGERANLSYANLRYANLSYANLSYANLSYADLSYADLSGIRELWGCTGNRSEIKAIQCDTYDVTYTVDKLQIGCQFHLITEWWSFTDEEISSMDSKALEWWRAWKPILKQIIGVSPANPTDISKEQN